jgi:hypothetical protein
MKGLMMSKIHFKQYHFALFCTPTKHVDLDTIEQIAELDQEARIKMNADLADGWDITHVTVGGNGQLLAVVYTLQKPKSVNFDFGLSSEFLIAKEEYEAKKGIS